MQANRNMAATVRLSSGYRMTDHAWRRMTSRGLGSRAIDAALAYGRTVHTRGAEIHVIGNKEVDAYEAQGVNLRPYSGLQVVCCPSDGIVMTVYRNRDLRGLRPKRRGHQKWN